MCNFKEQCIRRPRVIPYGGGIITEDIKEGCSIIEKHAEQLKVKFGSAIPDMEKNPLLLPFRFARRTGQEISENFGTNHQRESRRNSGNGEYQGRKPMAHSNRRKNDLQELYLQEEVPTWKNLRQLANYEAGFDSRIGFANEYVADDKNQF